MPRIAIIMVIAAAGLAACLDQSTSPPGAAQGGAADTARAAQTDTVDGAQFDLRLGALRAPRPERAVSDRNPFRFQGQATGGAGGEGPSGSAARRPPPTGIGVPVAGAHGPDARRPLRFIALVDAPQSAGLIAVLSDGETVFQGRVGDTIDGRYRIMSIGSDAAEVELLLSGERQVLQRDGT